MRDKKTTARSRAASDGSSPVALTQKYDHRNEVTSSLADGRWPTLGAGADPPTHTTQGLIDPAGEI
jgi:hypothetical protein